MKQEIQLNTILQLCLGIFGERIGLYVFI